MWQKILQLIPFQAIFDAVRLNQPGGKYIVNDNVKWSFFCLVHKFDD